MAPTDGKDKIWIQTVSHGSLGTLSNMIGGLVARGMEVPGDGFRVAGPAELHGLLDPGGDREQVPVRGDLSVGYHVALFYGLRVSEEIRLAEEMTLLPFEQIDAFVDKHVLLDVVPELIGHSRQKPVGIGALVKPFRWKA